MPSHHPRHFFVIVNYNSGTDSVACIRSIFASKSITPHIIVVDNASTDHSLSLCKQAFPTLAYIHNTHNIGFGAAANLGMRYAYERGATTITLCNPDALLDPECMHQIYTAMQAHAIHIASPVIYRDAHCTSPWFAGGTIHWWRFRAVHTPITTIPQNTIITETDYITGCVMTIDRHVCDTIGFFDEQFFLYYEDADLSVRAQKAGLSLGIITAAKALHTEVSEHDLTQKTYFLVLSGLFFFHKHLYGLNKVWFHVSFFLRRIKNTLDRMRQTPLAQPVYHAFRDYVSHTR